MSKKPSKFKTRTSRTINVTDVNVDQFLSDLDAAGAEGKGLSSATNRKNGTKRDGILDHANRSGEAENAPKSGRAQRSKMAQKAEAAKQSGKTPKTPLAHAAPKPERAKKGAATQERSDPAGNANVKKIGSVEKLTTASKRAKPPKPPFPTRFNKGSVVVELENGNSITCSGARDDANNRYVLFEEGGRIAIVPYADCHGGGARAWAKLREQGLIVIKQTADLCSAVAKVKRFPKMSIVTQSGWSRFGFVQSNLKIISPEGSREPLKALPSTSGLLDSKGDLSGWIDGVAAPIAAHDLAAFCMMAMFAAPLLRWSNRTDNFGFELVGEAGKGKSTLQLLIATVAGPAVGDGDTTYWRSLNSTVNGLEDVLQAYRDMPLILDEAALLPGTGRTDARALVMREVAFRLSEGRAKHRFRDPAGPRARLVYLLSSNCSIYSLLGTNHASETTAIADRLITLPVLPDRPFGIFDHCPEGYQATGAFAEALRVSASQHYGHAMPAYLRFLVDTDARAPKALQARIRAYVNEFVERSGADPNNGSQLRVAEAFGLVTAAGRLAKIAKVLPASYRPLRSALAAYELHRNYGRVPVSFEDRLRALMRHPEAIDLDEEKIDTLSLHVLKACPVFLYSGRTGSRELLVPAAFIDRVLPGWRSMRREAEVVRFSKRSSDRLTVDRPIGLHGYPQAVYCFDVTGLV